MIITAVPVVEVYTACYFRGGISFPNNMQLFNVCSTKQTKQLDGNLPSELEELLNSNKGVEMVAKLGGENATLSGNHSLSINKIIYPQKRRMGKEGL
jgi:hypothetical protein